jgi:hypothetical protein
VTWGEAMKHARFRALALGERQHVFGYREISVGDGYAVTRWIYRVTAAKR